MGDCLTAQEGLLRLAGKLPGYARLIAAGGPTYPVLFWLASPERETNLQKLLRERPPPMIAPPPPPPFSRTAQARPPAHPLRPPPPTGVSRS